MLVNAYTCQYLCANHEGQTCTAPRQTWATNTGRNPELMRTTFKPSTHHPASTSATTEPFFGRPPVGQLGIQPRTTQNTKRNSGNEHDSVLRQTFTRLTVLAANTRNTTSTFLDPSQHQPQPTRESRTIPT